MRWFSRLHDQYDFDLTNLTNRKTTLSLKLDTGIQENATKRYTNIKDIHGLIVSIIRRTMESIREKVIRT